MRRVASGALLSAAVAGGVILLISAGLLAYGLNHRDTMFSGTRSAGADLSGMTIEEARTAMQARLDVFLLEPIELTSGDSALSATPAELGVSFDVDATILRAYAFGRTSSLWQESRNWLDGLAGGYDVTPILMVDAGTFARYMNEHAASLAVAPREPAIVSDEQGRLVVDPGEPGIAVDVAATFATFRQQAMVMSSEPVEIVTVVVEPAPVDPQLTSIVEAARIIAGEPLHLSHDGTMWEITSPELFAMLRIDVAAGEADVRVDRAALRSYIVALKPAVFAPGRDASIENRGDQIVVTPAAYGQQLDVDASLAAAIDALESGERTIELVTLPVSPNITDADIATASDLAARMIDTPLTIAWENGSALVDPHYIATALSFEINPARNPKIVIRIDESILSGALPNIAPSLWVAPRNAELRWINGQVTMRRAEDFGKELDVAVTTRSLVIALRNGETTVAAATRDVLPEVNGQMASTIQFPDVLSFGRTEYGSSSADRFHNVELAANRLNGAMVPPGGIFSFNEAVGEVTFGSGYRTGYGIIATNGIISTIPSVGGGICQVATTVFHAAFRAGMPIERRSWHLYWIPRYGQPPSGMKGLDATVDADYNLDFKFRNATDNWIAIVTKLDGSQLTFEIVGTNPGWDVQIDAPVITNVRPANQQMVYEENSSLPAGTTVFVETAHEGFDARIRRVVRRNGEVIDEVSLFSTYAPARNVTLVGTGR
ncbi:MAG TPA: VanW family protein [Thermomicrobiales bacterium]|nr:VanW family protein [Thermomicrobiales bacterium]